MGGPLKALPDSGSLPSSLLFTVMSGTSYQAHSPMGKSSDRQNTAFLNDCILLGILVTRIHLVLWESQDLRRVDPGDAFS